MRLRSTAQALASEPVYSSFHVEVELEEGQQVREVSMGPGDPRDPGFRDRGPKVQTPEAQ